MGFRGWGGGVRLLFVEVYVRWGSGGLLNGAVGRAGVLGIMCCLSALIVSLYASKHIYSDIGSSNGHSIRAGTWCESMTSISGATGCRL